MAVTERSVQTQSAPNAGLTMVVDFSFLKQRIAQLQQFVKEYMVPGEDYGVIEGTGKPTLLKPGAEKLCDVYGLSAGEAQISFTRDDTKNPVYISYQLSLPIISRADGRVIMVGVGSANSWEKKYKWRWAFDNELPAGMSTEGLRTKNGTGKNGRPYTQYRVPNDDIDDIDNTLLKMAKKRALVDAVLSATRSSALFTQDIENLDRTIRGNETSERDEKRQQQPRQGQSSTISNDGGGRKASEKQINFLKSIAKGKSMDDSALDTFITTHCESNSLSEISGKEASDLIGVLKAYKPPTPTTNSNKNDDPFADDGEVLDINEDDLPF